MWQCRMNASSRRKQIGSVWKCGSGGRERPFVAVTFAVNVEVRAGNFLAVRVTMRGSVNVEPVKNDRHAGAVSILRTLSSSQPGGIYYRSLFLAYRIRGSVTNRRASNRNGRGVVHRMEPYSACAGFTKCRIPQGLQPTEHLLRVDSSREPICRRRPGKTKRD